MGAGTNTGTANLGRDETRARSAAVAMVDQRVALDLSGAPDSGQATFRSTSTVRFTTTDDSTWLDLLAPRLHEVSVNGTTLDPAARHDGARLHLTDLVADGTTVNEVVVVADCAYSRSGEGMHRFVDPVDDATYLYTQCEPADARRVFACFEQPDLRTPFSFDVTAPSGWQVRSNSTGTPTAGDDGTTRWDFAPTRPIATYITCVVAGPYHAVTDHWSGTARDGTAIDVPLALLCRASLADALDADEILTITKQGLAFFHEVFDQPYPFGRYDQAFVPEYNLGAMENPGLVTHTESFVFQSAVTDAERASRASTILHEMAHMWFGDLVTMAWWDDLWLKESFADYMGTLASAEATRFADAWTSFAQGRKAWAYRADQLPTTHPIVADITDLEAAKLNFDGITYAKGASVLKQLVAWVGRDAFFAGANRYFADHAWANTTLEDFLVALESTSGRDLRAWSRDWLETAGTSTLHVEVDDDLDADAATGAGAVVTGARLVQDAIDPATGRAITRPHRVAVGGYDLVDGALVRTVRTEVDLRGRSVDLADLVGRARPALLVANDDDLTYAKVVLDERSLTAVRGSLGSLAEALPRALVWSALWNATRDARLPAEDFVDVVARHGPAETHPGVLAALHAQVRSAIAHHAPASLRAGLTDRMWEVGAAAASSAPAGSDRQLAWLRLAVSTGGGQPDWLRGLLVGRSVPVGVTFDTDLRWSTWIELAACDQADDDALAAELAREDRAQTRRFHRTARAARPTDAAKDQAWVAVATVDDLPNEVVDAVLAGWGRSDQRHLTARFEDAYLGHLVDWWATRTIESARRIVRGLFPPARDAAVGDDPADHPTVVAVDGWLADHAHAPPALRRLVVEGRDDLVRSLTSQSAAPDPTPDGTPR